MSEFLCLSFAQGFALKWVTFRLPRKPFTLRTFYFKEAHKIPPTILIFRYILFVLCMMRAREGAKREENKYSGLGTNNRNKNE